MKRHARIPQEISMKRALAASPLRDSAGDSGPRTVAEAVHDRLRADLMAGRYGPGEALRLEPLMARYGCGISPLREALNRLSAERLVRAVGQRGFQAAPMSLAEMWDVVHLRQKLEGEALAGAIGAGDARWESEILAAFHRLAKAPPQVRSPGRDRADPDSWERSHRDFHAALIAACPSAWLLHFIGILYGHTERYRRIRFERTMPKKLVRDVEAEHRELMEAVLARDKRRAVRLLSEHLEKTGNFIAREFAANAGDEAPRRRTRAGAAA
jgi:GntR family transcriptional regulator, carbon starvation induced regulator